jgi:phosphoglycolate phosphatase
MALAFCAAMGLTPAEVAVVGDAVHDLAMAQAAGVGLTVGVLSGTSRREHLAALADILIDSVAELPARVELQGSSMRNPT